MCVQVVSLVGWGRRFGELIDESANARDGRARCGEGAEVSRARGCRRSGRRMRARYIASATTPGGFGRPCWTSLSTCRLRQPRIAHVRQLATQPTSTPTPAQKPYYITTPIFYVNAGAFAPGLLPMMHRLRSHR